MNILCEEETVFQLTIFWYNASTLQTLRYIGAYTIFILFSSHSNSISLFCYHCAHCVVIDHTYAFFFWTSTADEKEEKIMENKSIERVRCLILYSCVVYARSVCIHAYDPCECEAILAVSSYMYGHITPLYVRIAGMLNCGDFKGKQLINRLNSQVRPSTFLVYLYMTHKNADEEAMANT